MTDEYRDPDSHMHPNGTSDEICNRCNTILWRGADGWACNCDSAMYEYAKPEEQEPSMTSEPATETIEEAVKEPSPIERFKAILPDHAAIGGGLFSWSAQWTTPQGLWQIEKQTTFLKVEPLTLVGPGIRIVTSDIDLIITVLRHQNAIDTP